MTQNHWQIEVFFDGDCPLCRREIEMLRRRDRQGHIRCTDIAAEGFDATAYGRTQGEFMDRIQARLADGRWLEGVEVFRHLYTSIGFGWLVALTRLPGVTQLLDWAYDTFARNRLRLTGRCDPDGACRVPSAEHG